MIEYNYNITFCSIWGGKQSYTVTHNGQISGINKSSAYGKLHDKKFLGELFKKEHSSTSYEELAVLYCKVW